MKLATTFQFTGDPAKLTKQIQVARIFEFVEQFLIRLFIALSAYFKHIPGSGAR